MGQITQEALMVLKNNLTFTTQVNRSYDSYFAKSGAKIGDTVNVRKPTRSSGRRGSTLSVENAVESSVPVTLSTQYGADVSFTSKEMALDIDDFSNRILKPMIATVTNMIDTDGMLQYKNVYNTVGTAGTVPTALATYLGAGVKLNYEGAPVDAERAIVIDPLAQATIIDNLKSLFQSSEQIKNQYEDGTMGRTAGFKWSMDQNVALHTTGAYTGTPLVNGVQTSGSSIVTDGWGNSITVLKQGDVFTVANVFAVNPQNRTSTGQLRQFVATADVVSDGSGNATIPVAPSYSFSGAYQTCTSATGGFADNAAITVFASASATSRQHLAFHRDAFTFATADLDVPGGVDMGKVISSKDLGISLRMIRAYDINNDRCPCRLDVLGGWATLRPELACRVAG
jgi:hypothetical protein